MRFEDKDEEVNKAAKELEEAIDGASSEDAYEKVTDALDALPWFDRINERFEYDDSTTSFAESFMARGFELSTQGVRVVYCVRVFEEFYYLSAPKDEIISTFNMMRAMLT